MSNQLSESQTICTPNRLGLTAIEQLPKQGFTLRPGAETAGSVNMPDRANVDQTTVPPVSEQRGTFYGEKRIIIAGHDNTWKREGSERKREKTGVYRRNRFRFEIGGGNEECGTNRLVVKVLCQPMRDGDASDAMGHQNERAVYFANGLVQCFHPLVERWVLPVALPHATVLRVISFPETLPMLRA